MLQNGSKMIMPKTDHQRLKGPNRRPRSLFEGRNFVCGCAKAYFSHSALKTHIKTKHEGSQPEGTLKNGTIRRQKCEYDQKLMKQILSLTSLESFSILESLDENAKGTVAFESRIKRDQVGQQIVDAFDEMMKQESLTLNKTSSIEDVLVVYLLGAGQFVCHSLYHYYTHFAVLFRNCFKDCVQEVYDFCFKKPRSNETELNLEQCKLAPIVCDFFLRFYAPCESKEVDFLSAVQVISFDFCNWMYEKKLSIVEVTMKKKCMTLRKNLIDPKLKRVYRKRVTQDQRIDQYFTKVREERILQENIQHGEMEDQVQQLNQNQQQSVGEQDHQIHILEDSASGEQQEEDEEEENEGMEEEKEDEEQEQELEDQDEDDGEDEEELELEEEEEQEKEQEEKEEVGEEENQEPIITQRAMQVEEKQIVSEGDGKIVEDGNDVEDYERIQNKEDIQQEQKRSRHQEVDQQQENQDVVEEQVSSSSSDPEQFNEKKLNRSSQDMIEQAKGDCKQKEQDERVSESEGSEQKEKISEKQQNEEQN